MADLTSRPYRPDPEVCCEACVFKRGKHSRWCKKWKPITVRMRERLNWPSVTEQEKREAMEMNAEFGEL